VAYSLAPTYVFEGMRALLIDGTVRLDLMAKALAINMIYLGLGLASFYWFFRQARRHGSILQVGE
jgi:ABC-2 type transport system permease protein